MSRRPAADGLSALFDVFVLAQGVDELLTRALAGAPLTSEEYAVYSQLDATPGCTVSELAKSLAAPLTTTSDWVRTLVRRGHLAREVRAEDRRSSRLSLTADGRAAHRTTSRRFEQANAAFLDALPGSEADLRRALQQAVAACRAAHDEIAGAASASAS